MKHLHCTEGDAACRGTVRGGSFEGVCPDIACAAVCLSLSQSVYQSLCLSVCLPLILSQSVCLSVYLLVCLPFCLLCLSVFYAKLQSPQMLADHNRSRIWGRGIGISYSQSSESRLYNIIMFIYLCDLFTQDLHRICPTLDCAQ